ERQPNGAYLLTVRLADERELLEQKVLTLNVEGVKLAERGDLVAAAKLWQEAFALCRQLYPKGKYPDGHLNLADTLNNLGDLLRGLGKVEEARAHLEQALAIQKKALPKDHPKLASSLGNLGLLLHAQGKREEARRYFEQAL